MSCDRRGYVPIRTRPSGKGRWRHEHHGEPSLQVAEQISARAAKRGLCSANLSDSAGITTAELRHSLDGRRPFTIDELAGIARLVECTVTDLVTEPRS